MFIFLLGAGAREVRLLCGFLREFSARIARFRRVLFKLISRVLCHIGTYALRTIREAG